MKDDDFDGITEGIHDATAFVQGEPSRATLVSGLDIKAIRKQTTMTQAQFAKAYCLPLGTIKDWEQGRRRPDAPARALLTIIEKKPDLVKTVLAAS